LPATFVNSVVNQSVPAVFHTPCLVACELVKIPSIEETRQKRKKKRNKPKTGLVWTRGVEPRTAGNFFKANFLGRSAVFRTPRPIIWTVCESVDRVRRIKRTRGEKQDTKEVELACSKVDTDGRARRGTLGGKIASNACLTSDAPERPAVSQLQICGNQGKKKKRKSIRSIIRTRGVEPRAASIFRYACPVCTESSRVPHTTPDYLSC